ncbi:MAG: insulinase family protein [Lachnospiraceae bacterium]|nr:insulinase family protein [Lachnospiraceae bacterium]
MKAERIQAYEVVKEQAISELNSQAVILRHKKSGARLFLLSNEDENKVFTIGFRTPPADSTGLPHILEHSVLCGSRKFPAKDPFVELAKGSLNTFLNAMTYPDKTVYPVASCNDQDFQNLMDVYLDAVFYPNIYRNEKIFRQEGWHYELEDEESELCLNGVVYNEMKGEFSSPESILDRFTRSVLFPDTCYAFESGGDPKEIPGLSWEAFLEFHRRYYHPSNSYIYLYGDMDMEEKLKWLDEAYLSRFDALEVDSKVRYQEPFKSPVEKRVYFPITEEQSEEEESYLSVNVVTGTDLDKELYVAFPILEYALISAPGAPLKQALLDAGIGTDIFGGYESGILQPYFTVAAKGAGPEKKEAFLNVVEETLRKMAETGVNKKSLEAGINYYEFKYREADYGSFPKGLMYGLQCFDSWLYDETDPLMHLCYEETFRSLKKKAEEGYFESLIRDYLLDNPHRATVLVLPKKGLQKEQEEALAEKLSGIKASWSGEERVARVLATKELIAYQETPSPKEDLEKIPLLKREDIGRKAAPFHFTEKREREIPVIHSEMFTAGIGYLKILFDVGEVREEDLGYLGLLKSILGLVDTGRYAYQDLFNEIYRRSGGIATAVNAYPKLEEPGEFTGTFEFSAKVFYEELDFAFEMIGEMAFHSKFRDEKRLKELLDELKSRCQARLLSAGHSAAVLRAASYQNAMAYFNDRIGGIAYYKFLEYAVGHFDEVKETLMSKCEALCRLLFRKKNMKISYTADEDGYRKLPDSLSRFLKAMPDGEEAPGGDNGFGGQSHAFALSRKNEGFAVSSGVQYVARCGNFRQKGFSYSGVLRVLKVILSYDYLWLKVRVKGGAYGCMTSFNRTGEGYFVSYRDPNLTATNEVYENIPAYLENFDVDERDMTKYIIGTISEVDSPLNPSAKGNRDLWAYMSGVTEAMLQKEREQILEASPEDIRKLSGVVAAILASGSLCVIGNEKKVKEAAELFGEVKNLFA